MENSITSECDLALGEAHEHQSQLGQSTKLWVNYHIFLDINHTSDSLIPFKSNGTWKCVLG